MAKILIPLNNTPWGVMKYTAAPDAYDHIMSFDTPELKTQFVGKYLFNNVDFDYEAAMDEVNYYKSFVRLTETTAQVTIGVDEVNATIQDTELKYTLDELLSIDSLFVKENGITRLYSVDSAERTNQQNQQNIRYTLSQDIFFNHYDDLEFQGDIHWERAHTIRHNGSNFIKEHNRVTESIVSNWEPDAIRTVYPVSEDTSLTDSDLPIAEEKLLASVTFAIVYTSLGKSYDSGKGSGTEIFAQKQTSSTGSTWHTSHLPYNIFIFPINLESGIETDLWRFHEENTTGSGELYAPAYYLKDSTGKSLAWGRDSYNQFKNDTNIISIEYVKGAANLFDRGFFTQIEVDTNDPEGVQPLIRFSFGGEFKTSSSDREGTIEGLKSTWKHAQWYDDCQSVRITAVRDGFSTSLSNRIYLPEPSYSVTYEDLRKVDNEVKLQLLMNKFEIRGKNGSPYQFNPMLLGRRQDNVIDTFRLYMRYESNPAQSFGMYSIDETEQYQESAVSDYSALMFKDGYKELSKRLPTTSEAWETYTVNNAYERSAMGYATDIIGPSVKGGVSGAAAGFFIGGPVGALVGGTVGGTTSLVSKWISRASNKTDVQNRPNIYNGTVDNWTEDIVSNLGVSYVRTGYIAENEQLLFDMFTEIGYEVNVRQPFETFSNTRYYYNFIKTDSVFSNISNRLSSTIKQTISDGFERGLTVWHVRDLETFKGIVNYDYENEEMTLVEARQNTINAIETE